MASPRLWLSASLLLLASPAAAAPVLEGSPRWTESGPGVSDAASRYLLQARTTNAEADLPLAALLRDGHVPAAPPLVQLSLTVEGAGARHVQFQPWGWQETVALADGALTARAFTLARDVFAFVLELPDTAAGRQVTLEVAGGAPAVSGLPEEAARTAAEGRQSVSVVLAPGQPAAFVVSLAADSSAAAQQLSDAVLGAGEVAGWVERTTGDWQAYLARAVPPAEPGADVAEALAVLRMGAVLQEGEPVPVRSKGRRPVLALEEAGLVARALAELGDDGAPALLRALRRAQAADGRLPEHLGPLAADATATRLPRFLSVWWDVAVRTHDAAVAADAKALEAGLVEWWTRERDRDLDHALECNGALEGAAPGSPRFTAVWGDNALPAVSATSGRVPLDCVEAGAWVHAAAMDVSRLSEGAEAATWLQRAERRAAELEDGTQGHWDEAQGAYLDYFRSGTDKTRQTVPVRTSAQWAPLTVGAARAPARARRVLDALVDTGAFFTPYGVASVSRDEASFSSSTLWGGAVQPEVDWSALVALSRYGYEAEAAQLRERLLTRPLVPLVDARTGTAAGGEGDTVAAAVRLLAAAHADEAEVFLLERAGAPRSRAGSFQRVVRPQDGQLLMEVDTGDARLMPRVRLTSPTQLFAEEPMTVALEDPTGRLGGREVRVRFPGLASLEGRHVAADGTERPVQLTDGAWVARAGDRLEVTSSRLVGTRPGCGCTGAPAASGGLLVLALAGLLRRRR